MDVGIAAAVHVGDGIEQELRGERQSLVAAADRRDRREVAARAVAADGQLLSRAAEPAEMGRGPAHGGERVLDALREGVLRRQAIVDVEHHDACAIGQPDSMRLMAVDVADDEAAAVEEDERADRRPFGRGHAFDQDLSVRARSRKALELAGRQGRPGIEERADAARPLAADRPVAAGVEAGDAARLPFALQVGDRRIKGLQFRAVRHGCFLPRTAGADVITACPRTAATVRPGGPGRWRRRSRDSRGAGRSRRRSAGRRSRYRPAGIPRRPRGRRGCCAPAGP